MQKSVDHLIALGIRKTSARLLKPKRTTPPFALLYKLMAIISLSNQLFLLICKSPKMTTEMFCNQTFPIAGQLAFSSNKI